ncbi:MAG: cytochrome C [Proteobacteria bacterium]|nr:cytochrome C [Pseudomonadota bacterium]
MKIFTILLVSSILFFGAVMIASADDDDNHKKGFWSSLFGSDDDDDDHKKRSGKERRYMMPVNNTLYTKECSSCHWLFLPGLLPERSWRRVMSDLENHFGDDAFLEPEDRTQIENYLIENAADRTNARRSRKIMRAMDDKDAPIRITGTSYIRRKHHELNDSIYKRKSIRSFSNCIACHPGADDGNFKDDYVKIPRN